MILIIKLCHRAGKGTYLSLGNKKGVDIIVKTAKGVICIVEVKGVNERNDWLIGNSGRLPIEPNLIYVLICFHGKIKGLTSTADFRITPSEQLTELTEHKISKNEKTVYISNKYIREKYKNSFKSLDKYLIAN